MIDKTGYYTDMYIRKQYNVIIVL